MITESDLREELGRQAETYEVPPLDLIAPRAAAQRRRRVTRLRYGGAAAAGLLAIGIAWGRLDADRGEVRRADDGGSTVAVSPSCLPTGQPPPVPDSPWAGAGFVSDQPVPTTRADGRSCRLVLRYWFHRFGAGSGLGDVGPGLSGMVFLYSDGRLIIDTATGEDWFVQWERRLSPAGVERVREAVVSTLDLSASRPPRCPRIALEATGCQPGDEFFAAVHYGDRTVHPSDPGALVQLLIDRSWLSDEDWVTEDASVYRAAWYVTCYEQGVGVGVQAAVRELPSGARDVLGPRRWTELPPVPERRGTENGAPDDVVARYQCMVLSRSDARKLVVALGGDITVGTADVFPTGLGGPARRFSVHALMPDGSSGAHGD